MVPFSLAISPTAFGQPPSAPLKPVLSQLTGTATPSMRASWTAPQDTGRPPIDDYDVRHRSRLDFYWVERSSIADTSVDIDGLSRSTTYAVQVRANNADGAGPWSAPAYGSPLNGPIAEVANNAPAFPVATVMVEVLDNHRYGLPIGSPITATDSDGDSLNYRLSGPDADQFAVDGFGQISSLYGIYWEERQRYEVRLIASDWTDAEATVDVTISVRDPAAGGTGDGGGTDGGGTDGGGTDGGGTDGGGTDGGGTEGGGPGGGGTGSGGTGSGGTGGGTGGGGQADDEDEDEDEDPPPPPPRPPAAAFEVRGAACEEEPCRARTGVPVEFVDTSAGRVTVRRWDFGDGTASRSRRVEHRWHSPGFYGVTLSVSDGDTTSTASRKFLVEASQPRGTCPPDAVTRCLQDSRYAVAVEWRDGDGEADAGRVVEEGTDDSGMFWFFDLANWEVLVKVLDGCAVNGHVWVYAASTTDLGYVIRVEDTATGEVREYRNEPGMSAPAITDATAFRACDSNR